MKKTIEEFKNELKDAQPTIKAIGEYLGARNYISVQCNKCSHEWEALPTNLLKGRGCPKCARKTRTEKRTMSFERVLEKIRENNPDKEIIGEYKNTHEKVLTKCTKCGHEWMVLPSSLMRGSGCPKCARTGTSFVEQIIFISMDHFFNGKVESRNRTIIGMELDIYIPEKRVAIEYGAWNWHADKEAKDHKKAYLCEKKGIRLIEIFDAYTGTNIDSDNVWYFKENISKIENIHIVKSIIQKLCVELEIDYSLSDDDFLSIQEQARMNSRKMTTEQLNQKLAELDKKIVVLSEYHDMLSQVEAECLVCHHKWKVIPASILRNKGCPECGKKRIGDSLRKSTEQFAKEVNEVNPNVVILGEYINEKTKIKTKCKKHDYVWEAHPRSLLKGSGCPKCASEKIGRTFLLTQEQFSQKVSNRFPNVEVVGKYVRSNEKVRFRCKKCGHEWETIASGIFNTTGCPACAIKARTIKHEEFVEKLERVNPKVIVIGEYKRLKDKLLVKCKNCGYEWSADPSALLTNTGCPRCFGNKRKTHEEFLAEISLKRKGITVLGTYVNANTKILFQCDECGNEWLAKPTNILSGKGCPKCAAKRNYKNLKNIEL